MEYGPGPNSQEVVHVAVGAASSKAAAIAAARVVAQGSYGTTGSWSESWYYLDSIGQPYGPLKSCEMCRFFSEGRFPTGADLLVRLGDWQWHLPLYIVFPDLSQAFAVPPLWPRCISLPEAERTFCHPLYSREFDSDFHPWRDAFRENWCVDGAFPWTSQDSQPLSGQTAVSNLDLPTYLPSGVVTSGANNESAVFNSRLNAMATWFHPSLGTSTVHSDRMHFLRTSRTASCARRLLRAGSGSICVEQCVVRGGEAWCVGALVPGVPRRWASRAARPKMGH